MSGMTQEWVTKITSSDEPEISVIGASRSAPPERKIVQIAFHGGVTAALCNDDSTWVCYSRSWSLLPPIPQGDAL